MTNIEMNNNKFIPWFFGFVDAEGNFNISKKKRINAKGIETSIGLGYEFHLGIHVRDLDLLKFIQTKLNNLGKIYIYENKNKKEAKLVINRQKDVGWLIENIFSKHSLLTSHQATKYELLRFGFTNKFKKLSEFTNYDSILNLKLIPDFNNYSQEFIDFWIVGFFNGEVAFTYLTKDNKIYPRIVLEHTDQRVIDLIRDRLNIVPKIISRTRDQRKPTYMLFITSKKDINNTVEFLNRVDSLVGHKLIQYEEWKNKFNF